MRKSRTLGKCSSRWLGFFLLAVAGLAETGVAFVGGDLIKQAFSGC